MEEDAISLAVLLQVEEILILLAFLEILAALQEEEVEERLLGVLQVT